MPMRLPQSGLANILWLGVICGASMYVAAQQPQTSAAQMQPPAAPNQASGEVRFAVAHQHSFSWCYGYLYVSQEKVRFEVVQPQSNSNHSFEAPRTQVTVRQWAIMGQPQDAIELKVKGATFHMRWLTNESEVNSGGPKRMSPPASAAPATLIAAIQNPASVSEQGGAQSVNVGAAQNVSQPVTGSAGAGNARLSATPPPLPSDPPLDEKAKGVPPGMLAGIYVATAGAAARPVNKQYMFYPDGLMVYGIPQEGMIGFDFNHYRSESNPNKNWVGRYKVEGNTVKIVWQNQFGDPANPVVIKLNETSAHPAVDIGWEIFIPMCTCTGKKLSGKYRWGLPAADQYIQFFPDGAFIDHRVTDQLIVPSSSYEHPRVQRGTYSIQSQTIIFNFEDGHRGTRTFLAPKVQELQPTFDWIELGWSMLFEENYLVKLRQ